MTNKSFPIVTQFSTLSRKALSPQDSEVNMR